MKVSEVKRHQWVWNIGLFENQEHPGRVLEMESKGGLVKINMSFGAGYLFSGDAFVQEVQIGDKVEVINGTEPYYLAGKEMTVTDIRINSKGLIVFCNGLSLGILEKNFRKIKGADAMNFKKGQMVWVSKAFTLLDAPVVGTMRCVEKQVVDRNGTWLLLRDYGVEMRFDAKHFLPVQVGDVCKSIGKIGALYGGFTTRGEGYYPPGLELRVTSFNACEDYPVSLESINAPIPESIPCKTANIRFVRRKLTVADRINEKIAEKQVKAPDYCCFSCGRQGGVNCPHYKESAWACANKTHGFPVTCEQKPMCHHDKRYFYNEMKTCWVPKDGGSSEPSRRSCEAEKSGGGRRQSRLKREQREADRVIASLRPCPVCGYPSIPGHERCYNHLTEPSILETPKCPFCGRPGSDEPCADCRLVALAKYAADEQACMRWCERSRIEDHTSLVPDLYRGSGACSPFGDEIFCTDEPKQDVEGRKIEQQITGEGIDKIDW